MWQSISGNMYLGFVQDNLVLILDSDKEYSNFTQLWERDITVIAYFSDGHVEKIYKQRFDEAEVVRDKFGHYSSNRRPDNGKRYDTRLQQIIEMGPTRFYDLCKAVEERRP